ncbi:MAG: DUF5671 domain-containing protein [Parvularculaceae bacterium]
MADAGLVDFVRRAIEKGESRKAIAEALSKAGWPKDQSAAALEAFADVDFPVAVPSPRAKVTGSAREAFMLIVYFSLLGMVATQVGGLAFTWVDLHFADELSRNYSYYSHANSGLRWSVASLLVGYPIFLFIGSRLAARRRSDPERRRSRVRAWLTYVTLIFAAIALIGDLVAVVYQFLSGGLGVRFALKAIVVGAIAGAILFNYSHAAEREEAGADLTGKLLSVIATLIVILLVGWAFTITRGPGEARKNLADDQRIEGLTQTTRLIDCHYTYAATLPENLEAMESFLKDRTQRLPSAPGCAADLPKDPATDAPYIYRRLDGETYEICATFDIGWPNSDDSGGEWRAGGGYSYPLSGSRRVLNKPRGAGETCFTVEAARVEKLGASETANQDEK